MESNVEKLYNTFALALNVDVKIVNDNLSYQSIPEWDSISHMVLVSELESVFDVSLDTDDIIDLSSVNKSKLILAKFNIEF